MKYITLFIFLFLFACKKEKPVEPLPPTSTNQTPVTPPIVYDTLKPKSYFPVYPGSYWKYQKYDSSFQMIYTSPAYVLSYNFYVTLYNGEPIFGYRRMFDKFPPPFNLGVTFYEFLSEKTGKCMLEPYYTWCDPRIPVNHCNREFITFISKKVNANNDSVIVATGEFMNTNTNAPNDKPNQFTYREYTKNIGLTLYWLVDTLTHDTLEKMKLVDYHMNH